MHRPRDITVADFNRDDILDIATANYQESDTVSVLLGRTTGPPYSNDCNINGVPDECQRCIGDFNRDGVVNFVDTNGHPHFYGCEVGVGLRWCDEADVDADGQVNAADVGAILANFGECP